MNLKYVWLTPILLFFIGHKATVSRSSREVMRQLTEAQIVEPELNLDEYWPFPETISDADPYLYELEKKLADLKL
ncbi:hypothetical protein [Ekhidna sp.]|uniref:hypothetical protein n=1 Tax=Ekhidna sp. TaxID=2608089 RepID=UPI0032972245